MTQWPWVIVSRPHIKLRGRGGGGEGEGQLITHTVLACRERNKEGVGRWSEGKERERGREEKERVGERSPKQKFTTTRLSPEHKQNFVVNGDDDDDDVITSTLIKSDSHRTRGNDLRLQKSNVKYDMRKFYFTNRVVDHWNSLPNIVL